MRRKLPKILSREEAARLIDASSDLFQRTLLMVLYGTGLRRAEVARLRMSWSFSCATSLRKAENDRTVFRPFPQDIENR